MPSYSPVLCYFYPRSPCGERPRAANCQQRNHQISIHALLAESDRKYHTADRARAYISIHALLAESDPGKVKVVEPGLVFLSTLSLRRATLEIGKNLTDRKHFYPRSPCGERRRMPLIRFCPGTFLSTLSLRRATYNIIVKRKGK